MSASPGTSDRPPVPAPGVDRPLDVSVVACAYNEAQNLPSFLTASLSQVGPSFRLREILYVASGCTDATASILEAWARVDPRVHPVVEDERRGKAAALSRGLELARGDVLLVANADTVPLAGAFEALVRPLREAGVGLSCARLLPANERTGFTVRLGELLWEVHDLAAQDLPRSNGTIAFRRRPVPIPDDIEDDDAYVGILLGRTGGRSVYARDALFLHRVPEIPSDLIRQRYRINRQTLGLRRRTGMTTSTWRPALMARTLWRFVAQRPRDAPMVGVLVLLEGGVRLAAMWGQALARRRLVAWTPIRSTKGAIDPSGFER